MQDLMVGLSIGGLTNAGGTRTAAVRSAFYSISLLYFPGGGRERRVGDALMMVDTTLACSALEAQEFKPGPKSSGVVEYTGSAFLGAEHISAMDASWYQVCFRSAGTQSFVRTGVAVLVQMDLLDLQVNGLLTNRGISASFPRAPGSSFSWRRDFPDIGYHEVIQEDGPVAFYAFEDVLSVGMQDSHCLLTCATEFANEKFYHGSVADAGRGLSVPAGAGTGKYLLLDEENSVGQAPQPLNISSKALTVSWLMKPRPCLTSDETCKQTIISPLNKKERDFFPGSVAITFRKRPGGSADRVVQLQVVGCKDMSQAEPSDTLIFDYVFSPVFDHGDERKNVYKWFAVSVTLDVSATGDGVARLLVDGELVVTSGSSFDCTSEPQNFDYSLPPSPSFSALQLAPMSIGGYMDGLTVGPRDVFDGFLDEVAIFPYALSTQQIERHILYLPKADRIMQKSGYVSIVPWHADCQKSTQMSIGGEATSNGVLMKWASMEEDLNVVEVVQNLDSVVWLEPGLYQLCFTKGGLAWLPPSELPWLPVNPKYKPNGPMITCSEHHRAMMVDTSETIRDKPCTIS